MTDTQKRNALILAILGAVALIVGYLTSYFGGSNGVPLPEPSSAPSGISPSPASSPSSPSPSSSSSPSPQPSSTGSSTPSPIPSGLGQVNLWGVVGETVGQIWTATISAPVSGDIRAYEVMQVETRIPSFKGARVGLYDDPLKPVTAVVAGKRYWIEVTIPVVGSACSQGAFVCVYGKAGPMRTMPFYAELNTRNAMLAHGLPDTVASQCPIGAKYAALLRAHGVEPLKQYTLSLPSVSPTTGRLDLDGYFPQYGCDFRTAVLKGAIAAPMIVGPILQTLNDLVVGATVTWSMNGMGVSVTQAMIDSGGKVTQAMADARRAAKLAFLNAVKASVDSGDLPVGSFSYYWDEQEGVADQAALTRLQDLQPYGLLNWATRNVTATFQNAGSHFCPVVSALGVNPAWTQTGKVWCAYESCMGQGNCQNKTDASQVAAATGDVMMVIDAPAAHARAYASVLQKLGVPRGLYYSATLRLSTAWAPGGQYNEGGNGDGTFVYPGTDGNPWPSLRLKRLHRGLQDRWYWEHGGVNPVKGYRDFPQTEDVYEQERMKVWQAL